MSIQSSKSFNHQVYEKSYQRLKLSPPQRAVIQRLLGFLIRNDKPFPYSAVKMAELTGYSLRTVFCSLNELEKLRLIIRYGMGKNRRFGRGSILNKIFTTVQNRSKIKLEENATTVQLSHQNLTNRAGAAYKKTSLSLKRKEKDYSANQKEQKTKTEELLKYNEYVKRIEADKFLKLICKNTEILPFDQWKIFNINR